MGKFLVYLFLVVGISCSDNEMPTGQNVLIGTWELQQINEVHNGITTAPNDGKPVRLTFETSGEIVGVAGNNEIVGNYEFLDNVLTFTLYTSEITGTKWELLFSHSIGKAYNGEHYVTQLTFNDLNRDLMEMQYETNSILLFKKR